MEVTIRNLVGNYRYKVAELPDNTGYLIDLEAKAQDWFSPFGDGYVKRKSYPLKKEQLDKLKLEDPNPTPRKIVTGVPFVLTITIGYRFIRQYLTFDIPQSLRMSILGFILLLLVFAKVKLMTSRRERMESLIGRLQEPRNIRFQLKQINLRIFFIKLAAFLICIGSVIILGLILMYISFDLLNLILYSVILFFSLNLSLISFAINKDYYVYLPKAV
ncbi:hypothetical protein LACPH_002117 [Lacticaseibacillus parahuelsenbergensis]|uniref:DUF443 family protein n=1 Tax=Lacticaseibacillus parahuelsenbergensis TaxID=3068305 RepID=A0ABY9L1I5_9LACO|nr:hypothetical protein [Lacticaseibacillus sp. NCIMB 15471]WLV77373.1 hypothetical protein LACPH_002117 [Lacticaseibacillus sp. NCIMB 15471]